MKRAIKIIIGCIVLFISAEAYSQVKKPGVMVGVNTFYSKPLAEFAKDYRGGVGAEVLAGVGLGKTFITGSAGVAAFMAKSQNEKGTLTSIPVKVGVRQYLLAKRLFINGDVGFSKIKDKSMANSDSRFTRGIGAGVRLFGLEAGIYYDGFRNVNGDGYSNNLQYKIGFNLGL